MREQAVRDNEGRRITYARVSLTDACNFACPYCRPHIVPSVPSNQLLTVAEWIQLLAVLHEMGITSLRLTGGEPLLYPWLYELLAALQERQWFPDIALTTNGSLLAHEVERLRAYGVQRLNISLDAVHPEGFAERTQRGECFEAVIHGVDAAVQAGFQSVKINTVLTMQPKDDEVEAWLQYMDRWQVPWRFIEYMPFQGEAFAGPTLAAWKAQLERVSGGSMEPIEANAAPTGKGPASYARLVTGAVVGFIFPLSAPYCASCNRIRVTAEGAVRLCLLRDTEVSLRDYVAANHTTIEAAAWLMEVLQHREKQHAGAAMTRPKRGMWKIGG